jgi:hypothetical protein
MKNIFLPMMCLMRRHALKMIIEHDDLVNNLIYGRSVFLKVSIVVM